MNTSLNGTVTAARPSPARTLAESSQGGTIPVLDDAARRALVEQRLVGAKNEIRLGYTGLSMSHLLIAAAEKDPRICYVGVDTMDTEFQKHFPDRAFDIGIAEQNELGVATGLAKAGMIPIVQAWSPFTPIRNFDQMRTSMARHQANVKIVTTTLGLANCSHGATHHDMESLALFRVVPNLTILAPRNQAQFEQAFAAALEIQGPVVLMGPAEIYAPGAEGLADLPAPTAPPQTGKAEWLRRGKDAAIITFGSPLHYAWRAAEQLASEGIEVSLVNMYSLKPLDAAAIVEAASSTGAVLALEEQSIYGGLGSAVAEVLAEAGLNVRFKRMGIPDQFVEDVGDWTETRQSIGLTADGVVQNIRALVQKG